MANAPVSPGPERRIEARTVIEKNRDRGVRESCPTISDRTLPDVPMVNDGEHEGPKNLRAERKG